MGTVTDKASASGSVLRGAGFRQVLPWILVLCVTLVISRWSLTPPYLVTFDEINFALAVDHFNPAVEQPQPPGYPLFVGLLKLLSFITPHIETVFLLTSLLMSAAALASLWWLCEQMLGSGLGVLGPLLLLFNPAFWLSSLINPARLCLAAGATAVAGLAWLAHRRDSPRWLVMAALVLGLASGFRPTLSLLLLPLWLFCAWKTRMRPATAALSLLCFVAAVGVWLPPLIMAVGGLQPFVNLLRIYSVDQFSRSSLLFGAREYSALQMAWRAVVWSCLGVLSWIWLVPLVARRLRPAFDRFTVRFLGLWFIPGLLFYATFHVGDPDHTLSIIPALCVAGALVLAEATRGASLAKRAGIVSACVLLNVFLFFVPVIRTARASTYTAVQLLQDSVIPMIDAVHRLSGGGPVTAFFYEPTVGWRQLSYHEPRITTILLFDPHNGITVTRRIVDRHDVLLTNPNGVVMVPSCGTLVWVDPEIRPSANDAVPIQQTGKQVFFTPAG